MQIAENLEDMTLSINDLVSSPELPSILKSVDEAAATLNQTMNDLRSMLAALAKDMKTLIRNTNLLVGAIDRQVDPMAKGILNATEATTGAMNQARDTLSFETGPGADLIARMQRTFESATVALEQADTTLKAIDNLTGRDSEVIYTLTTTLEEIALAARSIRTVADYLERHPESLLRGKSGK
jgi:paraquat-inducible protein B